MIVKISNLINSILKVSMAQIHILEEIIDLGKVDA